MKWRYLLLCLTFLRVSAQDSIFLKSGFIIKAKIKSVNQKEVAFKKPGRKRGLLYFEETQNIDRIICLDNNILLRSDTTENISYQQFEYEEGQKITFRYNNLIYKNKKLRNFQLEELIKSHPDSARGTLFISYGKMISYRKQKKIFTCISAVLAFGVLRFGTAYFPERINLRGCVLATAGIAAGPGTTFFIALRKRHSLKTVRKEISELY